MFGVQSKFGWFLVASTTLTIFCFILTAHALIPHDHAHDVPNTGLLSSVHSSVAEKELELLVMGAVLVAVFFVREIAVRIQGISVRFRAQGPEVLALLTIRRALARGILNPRPH